MPGERRGEEDGRAAAYLAAATNLAAGLVMLVALRRGIPAGEDEVTRRLEYISEHTLVWRC